MSKANKLFEGIVNVVEVTFQLDRIERLSQGNLFLKIAYAQLIGNLNYAALHQRVSEGDPLAGIRIASINYPFSPQGRKAAMAESFRHFASKLDDFLSTANIAAVLGSIDWVGDIASAALRGSRVTQRVRLPKKS